MREGYNVENQINYKIDTCIEVVNFKKYNEVLNFGFIDINDIAKDINTVGVWKVKTIK